MKSLNLQILPQHFFLQCFKCWGFASNLNKPSAFTTSAATSSSSSSIAPLYVLSSSICASAPECKSHSHSQRRQKGKRSQYLWQGGDVSPYFTSDSIHSELLTFPRLSLLSCFFGGGQSMDLLWIWRVSVSAVDCRGVSSLLLLPSCFTITKRKRGDVCFAQASSISRLVRTGYRFDCVLRKKVSDLLIIFFFFLFWEAKVIAWADWCGSQGDVFFSLLLLSFQRQWTGQHVFCEGDGG